MKNKLVRKKTAAIFFFTLFLVASVSMTHMATATPKASETPEYRVVTTTAILADFAQNILGQEVEPIISPGSCPSHFDPSAYEAAALANADVVLCHGFEGWLDNLLESAENEGAKRPVTGPLGGATWNVPTNAIDLYIPFILNILKETYPDDNSTFEANAETLTAEIEAMSEAVQEIINGSANEGAKVAVMTHQRFFAEWLGLDAVVFWDKSDEAMSAADIVEVVNDAKKKNVTIVMSNRPSGTTVGADIAEEIGAAHVVLDNFPGFDGANSYIEMITQNAQRVANAGQEGAVIGFNFAATYMVLILAGASILAFKVKRNT